MIIKRQNVEIYISIYIEKNDIIQIFKKRNVIVQCILTMSKFHTHII
jgi:hypothetical protein